MCPRPGRQSCPPGETRPLGPPRQGRVGGPALPFLYAQVFFKIHTPKLTKRPFKRGQGGSAARKGAGLRFRVTGGIRSGLDGSVGWAREASTVNCRQHSFSGAPAEQVWLLEPDPRDDVMLTISCKGFSRARAQSLLDVTALPLPLM